MGKYQPRNSQESPRFCGVRTFMRLPLVETPEPQIDFAVMGAPFDGGQSFRTGSRMGPESIRDFSVLLRPYNVEQEINLFDYLSGVDYGDLSVVPGYIEESYERIEKGLDEVLAAGITPIVLGGDHAITLAELRSIAKTHGPVGLVHFDAHSDTWDSYFGLKYNHGTTFRRAIEEGLIDTSRGIQVGMRGPLYAPGDLDDARELGLALYTTSQLQSIGIDRMLEIIKERVGNGPTFLSFDVDFLDPVYAPGTGTPEVAGPTTAEALRLVRGLTGIDFVGFDVVEVLPAFDSGQLTAAAAANVAYEMITLLALAKRAKVE
ncbi:agmatinase [Alicyclobacillus sp. SO9]|uniref:agmatinase n=1 Tax=Alicyclobacillus sp. SO9 TaxID=2665646 RepID=UPI0018E7CE69|nr:agmatinase [Alicyclobacillus sp. SO9]QQE79302.1 agmatinase [Alicyclobacillus sp. SO9]